MPRRVRVVELEQSSFWIEDERVLVERCVRVAPSYRVRDRCEQQEAAHGSLSLFLVLIRRRSRRGWPREEAWQRPSVPLVQFAATGLKSCCSLVRPLSKGCETVRLCQKQLYACLRRPNLLLRKTVTAASSNEDAPPSVWRAS